MTGPAYRRTHTETSVDTAARQRVRNQWPLNDRLTIMNLLHEDLAHDRIAQRRREADELRLVRAALTARRARRSEVRASVRTRLRGLAGR